MEDEIDLREYIRVVLRQWKMIAGLALLGALVAGGVSLLLPNSYEATALLSVAQSRYTLRLDGAEQGVPIPVKAYQDLALSDEVLAGVFDEVKDRLAPQVDTLVEFRASLKVSPATDPSLLRLTVRDTNPDRAAQIANTWANVLTASAGRLYGQDAANLGNYEDQLLTAKSALDTADQELAAFQASNQVAILQAQLDSKQAILTNYLNRRHQLYLLTQDAQDLLARLATLDPEAATSLTDDLMVLSLSARMLGNPALSGELPQDSPAVPLQVQISSGQSLSGKTVAQQMTLLNELTDILEARIEDAQAQAQALEPEILELQGRLGEAQSQEDRLTRGRDLAESRYTTLTNKVQEARIATQESANILQVASEASVPTVRAGPRRTLNTLLGGTVGLMLGVFAAFVWEWWRAPQPSLAESTDPALRRVFAVKPDGVAAPSQTDGKKEAEQAEPVGSQLVQQDP